MFIKHCSDPIVRQLKCDDVSLPNQERPDIVLKSGNTVFAIEHISIPIITIENGSAARIKDAHSAKTYQKYKIDEENGINKLEGHENEAVSEIESIVNEQLEAEAKFSHSEYIKTCKHLLIDKHNAKAYLDNTSLRFPGADIRVVFMLDIVKPDIFSRGLYYERTDHSKCEFSVRNDYPFTTPFLDILRSVENVNYFFILWHTEKKCSKKDVLCYVLDPHENRALHNGFPIWASFDIKRYPTRKTNLILKK